MDLFLDAFERLLARTPHAVLCASATRSATAADIDGLARVADLALRGLGLPPGSVLALGAPNGPGFLAQFLAARRAGLVALFLDEGIRDDEVQRLVARFGVAGMLRCHSIWPAGARDFVSQNGTEPVDSPPIPPSTAAILLTSASTGEPRGLAVSTEALLADHDALAGAMALHPRDRLVAALPFAHSYGLSTLAFPALVGGNTLILPDGSGPFNSLAAAHAQEASMFPTVPAYLTALLHVAEPPPFPPSLRLILSAGAPLSRETAVAFRERYGRPVHSFYGSTECGGITYDHEGTAAERGTVGEPIGGVKVKLETVSDLQDGAARVVVSSPAVATAYVPHDPARLDGGTFVSDDLGVWVGRELALVGRLNNLINIRGRKVDPLEVERVIAALPAVREVHVIGIPRARSGDQVVAVVACTAGTLTTEEVTTWCRQRLNSFKVPRGIVLVDELPRGPRGKVDIAVLRQRAAQGLPHE